MSLNIQFEKSKKEDYTYSDIRLDLVKEKIPLGQNNLLRKSGNSDLKTDFDEYAIANSLKNLFSTRPRQRLLNPEYGLDLTQFLFENANEYSARLIARKIIQGIERYEPRVIVNNVDVNVNAEYNRYTVLIDLKIPTLRRNVVFQGIFDNGVFTL